MMFRNLYSSVAVLFCVGIALISPPSHASPSATITAYKRPAYDSVAYTSSAYVFKIEKDTPRPLIVTWDPTTNRVQMGNKTIVPVISARPSIPLMVACRGAFRPALS